MSTLGQQIKKIRESLGLTGEEFGKKLNVTKVAVSNWENNNRKPDLDMLVKIAKLGNTSVDSLLGLEKELSADSLKTKISKQLTQELEQKGYDLKEDDIPDLIDAIELVLKLKKK